MILVDFRFLCEVGEPLKVLCLLAKTEVRLFALRVELLVRRNLEKQLKSFLKSTATFSVDFGRSKWLARATRSDSERLGQLVERLERPSRLN